MTDVIPDWVPTIDDQFKNDQNIHFIKGFLRLFFIRVTCRRCYQRKWFCWHKKISMDYKFTKRGKKTVKTSGKLAIYICVRRESLNLNNRATLRRKLAPYLWTSPSYTSYIYCECAHVSGPFRHFVSWPQSSSKYLGEFFLKCFVQKPVWHKWSYIFVTKGTQLRRKCDKYLKNPLQWMPIKPFQGTVVSLNCIYCLDCYSKANLGFMLRANKLMLHTNGLAL